MLISGIGLDSCVLPIRDDLFLIQTVDFFYPLIDEPYTMGNIIKLNYIV